MRRKILRVRSAAEGRRTTKSTPEVWGPVVVITKDLAVIAHRIESHYVVSIMRKPIDLARVNFLLFIHSSTFFSLLQSIFTQDVGERRHAQGRDKKDTR